MKKTIIGVVLFLVVAGISARLYYSSQMSQSFHLSKEEEGAFSLLIGIMCGLIGTAISMIIYNNYTKDQKQHEALPNIVKKFPDGAVYKLSNGNYLVVADNVYEIRFNNADNYEITDIIYLSKETTV